MSEPIHVDLGDIEVTNWMLGPEDREAGNRKSAAVKRKAATDYAETIKDKMQSAVRATRNRDTGAISTPKIAEWLNANGVPSPEGAKFHPATVARILYETHSRVTEWATFEYQSVIDHITENYPDDLDAEAIERLSKRRDAQIEQGRQLERHMRLADEPIERPELFDPVEEALRRLALR